MSLKKLRIVFIILIITLTITSCGKEKDLDGEGNGKEESISKEKVIGGEINVPITYVKAVNPLLNGSSSLYYFNKLIFEGLFEFDESLEAKEKLVEKYKFNVDGSIDITLKNNILWHDGKELKSSDVKFTIDTIKYGVSNAKYATEISDMYKAGSILDISKISKVDVLDDRNMTIHFNATSNNRLETLTFPIISAELFDNNSDRALSVDNYTPMGTGAYKQVEYEKLKYVKLQSNKSYWGEKPYIETINGKILKNDELSLTSFESGQIDLTFSLDTDWEQYSQNEKVEIDEFPSRRYEFLAVNSKSGVFASENGQNIRKAIAYGINKDKIIDRIYLGHATKTNTPIIPKSYLSKPKSNEMYKYDVKKAKGLLEKAGYSDRDDDGIYEDENQKKLTIKLSTNSYNESRVRVLDMVAEDLKTIGIEVEKDYQAINTEGISEEEKEKDWEKFENKVSSGNFELALLGWETSFTQDISAMFYSSKIIGKNNFLGYENLELDSILEDIIEDSTQEAKKENYIKAQDIIVEDLPHIGLYFINGAVLSNKKINGEIDPSYINIYTNVDKWFIPKVYQDQAN